MGTRFRAWLRRWKRKTASRRQKAVLREFVYLDEVSVYSLIASRLGPIAAEFTETETKSLQWELAGSLGGGLGAVKGELKPRAMDTQTQGTQVLRKSIVQTTFKELYELEADSLALRPLSEKLKPPMLHSPVEIETPSSWPALDGWMIDPCYLTRGQLMEVEVQLEAESIFRVSAVTSALMDIVQENPEMFGLDRSGDLLQAGTVNRILGKLLAGLVPVRGYAIDYAVVENHGKEWIVNRRLLQASPWMESLPLRPLYVVGVAEQSLFWKDIRRVLFSEARFRVLCRVAQDGLQSSWTPVKLAHVIRSVLPDVANQIDFAGTGAIEAMVKATTAQRVALEQKHHVMREALVTYAISLAAHYDQTLTASDLAACGLPSDYHCRCYGSVAERREAFGAVTAHLVERFGFQTDPITCAHYRTAALLDAGMHPSGQIAPATTPPETTLRAVPEERFLDAEFVAIYW